MKQNRVWTIEAKTENGETVTLKLRRYAVDVSDRGGFDEQPGRATLTTADGRDVTEVVDGKYRINLTGQMLTSDVSANELLSHEGE